MAARRAPLALPFLVVVLVVAACGGRKEPAQADRPTGPAATVEKDAGSVAVRIAYGSEKRTWLEEQARAFEQTGPRTRGGKAIRIEGAPMGSGEAAQGIVSGALRPAVFSPASTVYLTLLNRAWQDAGKKGAVAPAGEPVVLSPVVIAMWRPMAEALGWPGKRLGWADLLAVNADARGWGAHGHPEWGQFKLGHTHPAFSNSGILAVLAEAYAGARKTRGLTLADLEAGQVTGFVGAVERTIVHYGKSTGFFADKMVQRGPSYLSAAVLYENLVIESYARAPAEPIVAIYPKEGTFWSDHPYAILDAPWVTPEEREGAEAFLAFLKKRPAQERALALGFRPADPAIAMGPPIDAAHGVDPRQPETLLEIPDADVLQRLASLWQRSKKPTSAILLFDQSGSMSGRPLEEAKLGARTFLHTLHDDDEVTLIAFSHKVGLELGPWRLGDRRADLERAIDGLKAGGGTALYDAVAAAYRRALERAVAAPARIHAVVVMTDGQDEDSRLSLERLTATFGESDVKVLAIGYGNGADAKVLGRIAEAARGVYQKGTLENIASVFEEMGAFL